MDRRVTLFLRNFEFTQAQAMPGLDFVSLKGLSWPDTYRSATQVPVPLLCASKG